MRLSLLTAAVAFLPFLALAQTPADARLATQNALFEEAWQNTLKLSPLLATNVGDYRYNDQLGDDSLASILARHHTDQLYLARITAISPEGFTDQDRLSHDLFARNLQQRMADFELKEYEMPINSQGGIHTSLADLPLSVPFDSVKHYEDYIARLRQIPLAFTPDRANPARRRSRPPRPRQVPCRQDP